MNKIKTGKSLAQFLKSVLLVAVGFSAVATLAATSFQGNSYADPVSINVKCKDGKNHPATRAGATFTLTDYQNACKDFGGYEDQTTDDETKCTNSGGLWKETATGSGIFSCQNCESGTSDGTRCVQDGQQAEEIDDVNAGSCADGEYLRFGSDGSTYCAAASGSTKCGNDASGKAVTVSFNFGCRGNSYTKGPLNPIIDIAFALFRFFSAGVGLIVVGSIIVAGIQYSTSRGNPQQTEASIKRITNSIIGLLVYIFMFAILNFLVPGGMFL